MLLEKERKLVVEYGKKALDDGLVKGTAGNISIYDPDKELMIIKPSGLGYYETNPEDIVVMKLDGTIVEGSRKPSSEWAMHAKFYEVKSEARSVVHTHQPYCTTFACMRLSLKPIHYVIAANGENEVKCAKYATFGTDKLAESAVEALGNGKAVLLANHGLITYGVSVAKAYSLANNLEYCAEIQWRCMCLNGGVELTDNEMIDVKDGFKSYGQPRKNSDGY